MYIQIIYIYRINPNKLQSPQRKIEALLARDVLLKESAQRAFVSYIKSVFLMKDKEVFNVRALNTDLFARYSIYINTYNNNFNDISNF